MIWGHLHFRKPPKYCIKPQEAGKKKVRQIQLLGTQRPPGAAAPVLGSLLRRLGGFAAHPPPRTSGDQQALLLATMNDDNLL